MDYSRPDRADRLAAEYVLGTLSGPARHRFAALLPGHPGLRDAVRLWQDRLAPLAESVAPVPPPASLWPRIETRLFGSAAPAAPTPWWRRLVLWQGLTASTTLAAALLLSMVLQPPPVQPPIVIVLGVNPGAPQAVQARFVASLSADGRALVLEPIDAPPLTAVQALELWAVPPDGAPRSLGLVRADSATTLLRSQLLSDTAALAVSIEPAGGSPSGAPTGPVVAVGKLRL
jgi:anti-sigma-K factor RskA